VWSAGRPRATAARSLLRRHTCLDVAPCNRHAFVAARGARALPDGASGRAAPPLNLREGALER